jgi:predicted hotdog family 3-hydroxylacyl-ACP dehydratase
MMPNREAIERMVPHAGSMCLLDAVIAWDPFHIACSAVEPCATHPLARDGRVPAVAACEYAAQASAVHGALLDNSQVPRAGMLAKLMDVRLHSSCFPAGGGPLDVRAELLGRTAAGCLYAFDVGSNDTPVASGRLMVAFATVGGP